MSYAKSFGFLTCSGHRRGGGSGLYLGAADVRLESSLLGFWGGDNCVGFTGKVGR